jgi:hypothetical protein
VVHILAKGRIQATGGPELAEELEATGYAGYLGPDAVESAEDGAPVRPTEPDPFGPGPFSV